MGGERLSKTGSSAAFPILLFCFFFSVPTSEDTEHGQGRAQEIASIEGRKSSLSGGNCSVESIPRWFISGADSSAGSASGSDESLSTSTLSFSVFISEASKAGYRAC